MWFTIGGITTSRLEVGGPSRQTRLKDRYAQGNNNHKSTPVKYDEVFHRAGEIWKPRKKK
jgi:hypothetical protein